MLSWLGIRRLLERVSTFMEFESHIWSDEADVN